MTRSTILKLIHAKFGEYKPIGKEVQVNCPFCILRRANHLPDTSYKLYINIQKGVYNCFRCEAKGHLSFLFPQLEEIAVEAENIVKNTEQRESLLEPLPEGVKLSKLRKPWDEIVYPFLLGKGFAPASLEDTAYFVEEYKKKDYSFGPCLVFPIHQFGSYRGFQARTVYKNTTPKYIGASSMDRKSILYGYDEAFSQKERLVITEGFFDKLKVGSKAIATLGKNITDIQLRLIRLGEFKDVIVFLDKDAKEEAISTAKKIALYFRTYLAVPTKKDPGDMSRTEILEVFQKKLERIY